MHNKKMVELSGCEFERLDYEMFGGGGGGVAFM